MITTGKFLILGCGSSLGVPVIGCTCKVCSSTSPYNKRLRPAGCIFWKDKKFLVDASPDFRAQALHFSINEIDGILFTHAHNDHIGGMDDLRIYSLMSHRKIPCLLSEDTLSGIRKRYHYLLHADAQDGKITSKFHFHTLPKENGEILFEGLRVHYMSYHQSTMRVTGFRLKNFAYLTDIHTYSDHIFSLLEGVNTLVISAPRWNQTKSHLTIEEAISFTRHLNIEKTYFTHLAHDLDYEETNRRLPSGFELAYDGLEITIEIEGE